MTKDHDCRTQSTQTNKARLQQLQVRDELLENVFENAKKGLVDITQDANKYSAILERLVLQVSLATFCAPNPLHSSRPPNWAEPTFPGCPRLYFHWCLKKLLCRFGRKTGILPTRPLPRQWTSTNPLLTRNVVTPSKKTFPKTRKCDSLGSPLSDIQNFSRSVHHSEAVVRSFGVITIGLKLITRWMNVYDCWKRKFVLSHCVPSCWNV